MKKGHPWLVGSLSTTFAYLLLLPACATAEDQADSSRFRFQYAAKFLCTANVPGTSQTTPSVVPGSYQTVISIHNPENETVLLRKKIALTSPEQKPGPVSGFVEERLQPDNAFQVDCSQISQGFGFRPIHGLEGFLVVESNLSLDVNAVYTASRGSGGPSIAVLSVSERRK
jgi:hypothetical protein